MNNSDAIKGVYLPVDTLNTLFPFYLIINSQGKIIAFGSLLAKLLPEISIGSGFCEHFIPDGDAVIPSLITQSNLPANSIRYLSKDTKLCFTGDLHPSDDQIMLLWSPVFSDLTQLRQHGLTVEELPKHSLAGELLEIIETHKITLQDERDLAEKLSEQRADLIQANAELSRQFSQLWEELVALKQIEAETFKIALIANNTENSVVMTDNEGKVEWVNESFTNMTGYSLEEMLGKTPGSVLQGEKTDQEVIAYVREQIKLGESFGADILNYTKTGKEYWVQFEVQPIRDEENHITNWMAIERDITEQKLSELALREAKLAAEAASRAKSAFLATMSHEIRTPMNAVLGTLSLLIDSPLDQEQKLWSQSAYIAAHSLLNIIDDILDFSKIEAGKLTLLMEDFDLYELIAEILQIFRIRTEGKGIKLLHNISENTPAKLHGDSFRLKQILINLIGNAVKFTEEGRVEINISIQEQTQDHYKLLFQVRDTGIGISEDSIGLLFNQFVQVDSSSSRKFSGTGLGLAICKRLAELMGGEIGVESEPNKGSTFWFTALLYPASLIQTETDRNTGQTIPDYIIREDHETARDYCENSDRRKKESRILVAEDGEINRLVITAMLQKAGYNVNVAKDGQEAVNSVLKDQYDLILMDVQMPEKDGYQATMEIRAMPGSKAQVPIIAFTANALQEDRNACLTAGMNDFIAKPVEKEKLLTTVATWLRKSITRRKAFHQAPVIEEIQDDLLLDDKILKVLADQIDDETLRQTVVIFLYDMAQRSKLIQQAILDEDHDQIRFEAHSIKSAAQTLGACRLASRCREVEIACGEGNQQAIERGAKNLLDTITTTRAALQSHGSLNLTNMGSDPG